MANAKEVLMFKYKSSDGQSQFRDVELLQAWKGFLAGQKIPRLSMTNGKVWFYLEKGTAEFILEEGGKVSHVAGEATLEWQAQVAFEMSDVGQDCEGRGSRLGIQELWKAGWMAGATR